MAEWRENQLPTPTERPEHWVMYFDGSLKLEGAGVNTKNWYRKETDMWSEFGRRVPFDRRFFLKAFGKGICGHKYVVVWQKDFSTGESEKHSGMRDNVD
jgi:hypothetical protein